MPPVPGTHGEMGLCPQPLFAPVLRFQHPAHACHDLQRVESAGISSCERNTYPGFMNAKVNLLVPALLSMSAI